MPKLSIYMSTVVTIILAGCNGGSSPIPQSTGTQVATATSQSPTITPVPGPTFIPTLEPLPTYSVPPETSSGASVINVNNVQQLSVLAKLGQGMAYDFYWSPSDDFFVINTSVGLYLYDTQTWKQIKKLEPADAFDWSSDGSLFVTTSNETENGIQIYDGKSFEQIKSINTGSIFEWSPDGQWLATLDSSRVYLYDANSLELEHVIQTSKSIWRFTFSPDGKLLATLDGQVQLWDTTTGKLARVLDGNQMEADSVYDFAFSPGGNRLLFLGGYGDGFDFVFEVWDSETGQNIYHKQDFVGHGYAIDSAFSFDGGQIALFVYENITIIDSESGEPQKTISAVGIDNYIDSTVKVTFGRDEEKIISTAGVFDVNSGMRLSTQGFPEFQVSSKGIIATSTTRDSTTKNIIQLWDMASSQLINSLPGQYNWIYDVAFSYDGQYLSSFDEYGNVQIHETATGVQIQHFEFDSDTYNIAFGPITNFTSGYILAVSDDLGDIQVWDTGKNKIINKFMGYGEKSETTNAVAVSPNGQLLAYHAREDGIVQVVDLLTGKMLRRLTGADERIHAIAFSPNGTMVVAGSSNDNNLYFWDIASGQLLNQVNGNSYDFAFLPDTEQIAWGYGNSVQIWDAKTNQTVSILTKTEPGIEEWYLSVALSFDGKLVATGTSNGLIDIWDIKTGQILKTLEGHETVYRGRDLIPMADVESLDFSLSGDLLASTGTDCSMRLWNVATGEMLATFSACGPVAFSPDGRFLAYASSDKTVTLMGVPQ